MPPVITAISTVSVVVSDQDRSLAFYTEKLGFELQMDAPKPTQDMPAATMGLVGNHHRP